MSERAPTPFIDTHCHLDFPDYDADRDAVVQRSRDAGVIYLLTVGSSIDHSRRSVSLAQSYTCVYAAVGVHPHEADGTGLECVDVIRELAGHPKVRAIGEIGLDYFKHYSDPNNQRPMFVALGRLAKDLGLPIVVHSRNAGEDTLKVLRDLLPLKAVIHCFSGDRTFLDACLDLGFYVSFTCNITYKNAQTLRDLARDVPLERLMLETDAPYLSPEGSRGQRNEPWAVRTVAETLARIKGIEPEAIAAATTANAKAFFNLP
jgi:TatD DNase family protein